VALGMGGKEVNQGKKKGYAFLFPSESKKHKRKEGKGEEESQNKLEQEPSRWFKGGRKERGE